MQQVVHYISSLLFYCSFFYGCNRNGSLGFRGGFLQLVPENIYLVATLGQLQQFQVVAAEGRKHTQSPALPPPRAASWVRRGRRGPQKGTAPWQCFDRCPEPDARSVQIRGETLAAKVHVGVISGRFGGAVKRRDQLVLL